MIYVCYITHDKEIIYAVNVKCRNLIKDIENLPII